MPRNNHSPFKNGTRLATVRRVGGLMVRQEESFFAIYGTGVLSNNMFNGYWAYAMPLPGLLLTVYAGSCHLVPASNEGV